MNHDALNDCTFQNNKNCRRERIFLFKTSLPMSWMILQHFAYIFYIIWYSSSTSSCAYFNFASVGWLILLCFSSALVSSLEESMDGKVSHTQVDCSELVTKISMFWIFIVVKFIVDVTLLCTSCKSTSPLGYISYLMTCNNLDSTWLSCTLVHYLFCLSYT